MISGTFDFAEKVQRYETLSLMKAQTAVAEYPEFQGNVAFVGTKSFWRPQEQSPSGQGITGTPTRKPIISLVKRWVRP